MKKSINSTVHVKKQLLEALTKTLGVVTSACKMADVSRTTYYKYMKDPKFKAQADDIEEIALDFTESKLHKQIEGGNITAIIFHLKTKGKSRGYVERVEQEIKVESKGLEEAEKRFLQDVTK